MTETGKHRRRFIHRRIFLAVATAFSALVAISMAGSTPAAEASPASWSAQTLPWTTPGPFNGVLNDVWCFSKANCVAVGTALSGSLVSNLTHGRWTPAVVAAPAGTVSPTFHSLSCPSKGICTAVGVATSGDTALPLVGELAHGTWTSSVLPSPGTGGGTLVGVDCVTSSSCVAVGFTGPDPLIETLASGTWSSTILAPPSGSDASLSAVSCPEAGACMAVGWSESEPDGQLVDTGLVATLAGDGWTETSLDPSNGANGGTALGGVTCRSMSSCVAVGSSAGDALVEQWSDGTWTPTTGIDPSSDGAFLSSVTCASASRCLAFGWYGTLEQVGLIESPLVETLAHGRWTPTALPDSAAASFHGASCVSARACVGVLGGAVATLKAARWTIAALPGPPDASLTSVSCPSTSACAAVGTYLDATNVEHVTVETRTNGTWAPQSVALASTSISPPAVSCTGSTCMAVSANTAATSTSGGPWVVTTIPNTAADHPPNPVSISCTSATACVAVGTAFFSNTIVVATLTSTGWTAADLPDPPSTDAARLTGVSCQSSTSCVAVGQADLTTGIRALVEVLSGTTWTATVLPLPATYADADLDGVTCTSALSCVAAGSAYGSTGGDGFALIETLSGGSWSPTTGLAGGDSAILDSPACPGSGSCVALGSDFTNSPKSPLAESLSGGSWTTAAVTLPPGSGAASFSSASCATTCTGVGSDQEAWSVLPGYEETLPLVATNG